MSEKSAVITPLLRQVWALLGPDKLLLLVYLLMSVIAAVTEGVGISLLIPFLQAGGASNFFADKPVFGVLLHWLDGIPDSSRLAIVAGVLLIVIILRGAMVYAVQVIGEILPFRVQQRMMDQAYKALINVEIGYLSHNQVGVVSSAVAQLPIRIASLVLQVAQGFFSLILIIVYAVLMLAVSWSLTLVTIAFFGLASLVLRRAFTSRLNAIGAEVTAAMSHNSTLLHETINGLRLIRLSSAETAMSQNFSANTRQLTSAKSRIARVRCMPAPILATVAGAFICALLAGGSIFVGGGQDDNGWVVSILLFNVLVFRLLSPVSTLNMSRQHVVSEISAVEEYTRFLRAMADNRQPSGTFKIVPPVERVSFEKVSFVYPTGGRPALKDFSLTIAKGSMTALVGPSGAGKSTIAGLLARLYDPCAGRILVNGVDLRTVDVGSWHQLIGYVSQEAFIFNDTLANNMRFVQPKASDEEIVSALRSAAATDILAGMPDGLQTVLGDRGTRLSGGQIQRIALARALLSDPELLILDEATSALDSITEAAIQRALDELLEGRTVLAIAHRLSTIFRAENIVVLDNGVIREQGTHDFLRKHSDLYRELLRHQMVGALA